MVLEWCVGVAMLTAAGLLYNKKALPLSEWDRFGVVWRALPEELRQQLWEECDASGRDLLEQAKIVPAGEKRSQALAEFLAALLGVGSQRVAEPEQAFRDLLQTHSGRVLSTLKKQIQTWTGYWLHLDGKSRAAVLLMTIPPQLAAEIFQILGADEVESITPAISKLPPIPAGIRQLVIQHFLGLERSEAQLEQKLSALAARDPQLLANMLRAL